MNWRHPVGFAIEAIVAVPLGGNAGSNRTDLNQDGSRERPQVWINLSQVF